MKCRILRGDCIDVLKKLSSGSVQCCVTSPPYFGLRAYLPGDHKDKIREIGAERTPDAYVAKLVDVFREVRRVLRDDGTVFLNLGDSYAGSWGARGRGAHTNAPRADFEDKHGTGAVARHGFAEIGVKPKDLLGIPWRVAFALQADGWWLRSAIVWAKPNPMPESVTDRPTSAYEMVFLLAKSATYFYDADAIAETSVTNDVRRPYTSQGAKDLDSRAAWKSGEPRAATDFTKRNARNVWTITPKPYKGAHFATMPPELAERCIKAGTSERGCCPTCRAPWGRVVKRQAMVIRRSERTHELGRTRSSGTMLQPATSETIGWAPSCACPAHTPIPCTVLDPFGGAGTTALAALQNGRHAILVELNAAYVDIAKTRLQKKP